MSRDADSTTPKPFVFVLMPFNETFSDIYKFGIKGAADDSGAYAERVDEQLFTEGILDRIFNQISKADVIVADMTGRSANVFYEVGYAHALGKIVLLLTQNADDIPFDLKHRQHIVYGGKIETLRKELTDKLIWAIGEAKRKATQPVSERFLLSVFDVEMPERRSSGIEPVLDGKVSSDWFEIEISIQNGSLSTTPNITHIYLFASPDSDLVPCIAPNQRNITTLGRTATFGKTQSLDPLRPIHATGIDAEDGLSHQYRINATVPSLPPGAVDQFSFPIMFTKDKLKTNCLFRLRIHSSANFYDFSFRLITEKIDEVEEQETKN